VSAKATFAAWNLEVGGNAKLVALSLGNFANEMDFAWPSKSTIARQTGLSLPTVKRQIKELLEAGHIEEFGSVSLRSKSDGRRREVVRYRLNFATDLPDNLPREADEGDEIQPESRTPAARVQNEPSPDNKAFSATVDGAFTGVQIAPVQNDPGSNETPRGVTVNPNPNINPTNTISPTSSTSRAAIHAFSMSLDWHPDLNRFAELMALRGIVNEMFSPEALNEFRIFWQADGRTFRQEQWEHKLASSLIEFEAKRLRRESSHAMPNFGEAYARREREGRLS